MPSSSSYYYSSASGTTNGTEASGHRCTTTSRTDASGNTTVWTAHQNLGEPAVIEERRYDRTGQELLPGSGSTSTDGTRRIADLGDVGASVSEAGTNVIDPVTGRKK
jgi:hypothetical protein